MIMGRDGGGRGVKSIPSQEAALKLGLKHAIDL